jgi:hypothetical protein
MQKYPYNSPYAFAENRVIDGREFEGLEVVLAGYQTNASVFISIEVETGIAVGPNGIYAYVTYGGGVSNAVSTATGVSITLYPTMPLVQDASGWGYSAGIGIGALIGMQHSVSGVKSNGYYGINYVAAVGGGITYGIPITVSAGTSNTTLFPLSKLAKSEQIKYLGIAKVQLETLKKHYSSEIKNLTAQNNVLNSQNEILLKKSKLTSIELRTLNNNKTKIASNSGEIKKAQDKNKVIDETIKKVNTELAKK